MEDKMRGNLGIHLLPWIEQFVLGIPHLEKHTRQVYRGTLLAFVAYLEKTSGEEDLSETIKEETITRWLREMKARRSLKTVLLHAWLINAFLSFLKKNGYLEENPLARLQGQYPRKGLKVIVLALLGSSPEESLNALKLPPRFTSPLGPYMEKFIALHRSQGIKYETEEYILCRFDRFLLSYSDPPPRQLSDSIFRKWLELFSGSHPGYRYTNFIIIRRFCLYLHRFDPEAYVSDSYLTPSPGPRFFPHIYSISEIVALLRAARQMKQSTYSPLRPQIFYLLILLLYTTGMRLGEALRLKLEDIDWKDQALYIRQTKFFKSRLVPLSSSMMKELEDYLQLRQRSGAPVDPKSFLFQNPHEKVPYSNNAIEFPFRCMLRRLGLKAPRGRSGPRIHDLRHYPEFRIIPS